MFSFNFEKSGETQSHLDISLKTSLCSLSCPAGLNANTLYTFLNSWFYHRVMSAELWGAVAL